MLRLVKVLGRACLMVWGAFLILLSVLELISPGLFRSEIVNLSRWDVLPGVFLEMTFGTALIFAKQLFASGLPRWFLVLLLIGLPIALVCVAPGEADAERTPKVVFLLVFDYVFPALLCLAIYSFDESIGNV